MDIKPEYIGLVAGIITSSSLIPQLVKTIKEKKAEGVSVIMFLVLLAGTSMWIYYGVLRNDMPIIITNAFSCLLNIAMLSLKYWFDKEDKSQQ